MIGEKIREARKAAGLKQAELAERVGVNQKDVSRWETGLYEPSLVVFRKICIELGVSADYMLELTEINS